LQAKPPAWLSDRRSGLQRGGRSVECLSRGRAYRWVC